MSQSHLNTKTARMEAQLKGAKICMTEMKGSSVPAINFGGKIYRVQTGDDFTSEQSFVSIGENPFAREATLVDANSECLLAHYEALQKTITEKNPEPSDAFKLQMVIEYVRSIFKFTTELTHLGNWNGRTDVNHFPEAGIVSFDWILKDRRACCRHYAILTAFLTKKLIQDKILPPGKVHTYRDMLARGGHSWVIYRPYQMKPIDAYVVDSVFDTKPHLINGNRSQLEKTYGKEVINNCIFRFLSSWSEAETEFFYNSIRNTFFIKTTNDTDPKEFKLVKELGEGSFGKVFMVQAGTCTYAVKEMSLCIQDKTWRWRSREEFEKYLLFRFQASVQEAQFNLELDGIGASFCTLEPIHIKWDRVSGVRVLSYPRLFSLLKFKQGVTLNEFKVTSTRQFIKLAMALTKAAIHINQKFFHLDIHPGNVLVHEESKDELKVELVDFTLSQFKHSKLYYLGLLNQNTHPPEYKDVDEYLIYSDNQDVYGVGLTLKDCFDRNAMLFGTTRDPYIDRAIQQLFSAMLHKNPAERLTMKRVLEHFTVLLSGNGIIQYRDERIRSFVSSLKILTMSPYDPELLSFLISTIPTDILNEIVAHKDFLAHADLTRRTKLLLIQILFKNRCQELSQTLTNVRSIDQWCALTCELHKSRLMKEFDVDASLQRYSAMNEVHFPGLSHQDFIKDSQEILQRITDKTFPSDMLSSVKTSLEIKLQKLTDYFELKFPDPRSIDSWCYCIRWLNELEAKGPTIVDCMRVLNGFEKVALGNMIGYHGISNISCLITIPKHFFQLLSKLNPHNIKYFLEFGIRLLNKIVAHPSFFHDFSDLNDNIQIEVLRFLMMNKMKGFVLNFPDKKAIDAWCICQANLINLEKIQGRLSSRALGKYLLDYNNLTPTGYKPGTTGFISRRGGAARLAKMIQLMPGKFGENLNRLLFQLPFEKQKDILNHLGQINSISTQPSYNHKMKSLNVMKGFFHQKAEHKQNKHNSHVGWISPLIHMKLH